MSFIIGILTFFLVVNCLLLILLVLIQLPKKEAGMGSAFGGGATEALFGAGSGNVLTKLTKFAAGSFLIICFGLSVLIIKNNGDASAIDSELEKVSAQAKMEAAKSAVEAGAGEAAASDSVTVTSTTTNGISATATVSGSTPEAPTAAEGSDTAGSLEQLINNIQEETKAATDQVVETAEDLLNTGAAAVEEVVTPEATTEPEPEPEVESVPEAVEAPAADSSVEAPQP